MSKVLHRSLEAKLAALNGPEWDSSDDEGEIESNDTKSKNGSKKKKEKSSKTPQNKENEYKNQSTEDEKDNSESSSVIYIGHIPPAFEEVQILKFFSQFGRITNIKLSRAKRTGNSRGYAFVRFDDKEVASIVADTMGGYFLMGERRLVCHVVPKEKVHPKLFQGSKRNLQLCQNDVPCSQRIKYWQDKEREVVNKERSMDGIKKITKRLLSREKKKREQLKALGIDYDFPGYKASLQTVTDEKDGGADDDQNEKKKKRKVSVDEKDSKSEKINAKKAKKKATPVKESKTKRTRKVSEDKDEGKDKQNSTPQKDYETKKASSEIKLKKKPVKRRKSVS